MENTQTDIVQANQQDVLPAGTQSAALNVWQNKEAFDQVARVASMLSKSSIVPQNYQGKPEDCFIAVELASRMNTSPLFIMQNLYVVKGKPSWAGQACMAMIMSCGKFRNVKHVYTGTRGTDNRGCYVTAERISDGEIINGTEVTIQMAKNEGWLANSKWKNMPEQMLGYRAASFFARMYCPEAMMGIQTTDEVIDADAGRRRGGTQEDIVCVDCGNIIAATKGFKAGQIVDMTVKKYGRALCFDCAVKAREEAMKDHEEQKEEQNHEGIQRMGRRADWEPDSWGLRRRRRARG